MPALSHDEWLETVDGRKRGSFEAAASPRRDTVAPADAPADASAFHAAIQSSHRGRHAPPRGPPTEASAHKPRRRLARGGRPASKAHGRHPGAAIPGRPPCRRRDSFLAPLAPRGRRLESGDLQRVYGPAVAGASTGCDLGHRKRSAST